MLMICQVSRAASPFPNCATTELRCDLQMRIGLAGISLDSRRRRLPADRGGAFKETCHSLEEMDEVIEEHGGGPLSSSWPSTPAQCVRFSISRVNHRGT
jgi:hypothetical protein